MEATAVSSPDESLNRPSPSPRQHRASGANSPEALHFGDTTLNDPAR